MNLNFAEESMNRRCLFLTSCGLSNDMKRKFFDTIEKCPEDVRVLYIPTAGIETDGAREGIAICFDELLQMGYSCGKHIII